jgi:microsomal dipeptidase-like Zn-dependent dipeptidase
MRGFILSCCLYISQNVSAQQTLQHVSAANNINANSTFITAQGLNGRADAIVTFSFGGITAEANPHVMGVWYNGSQWAIYNQDRAPMPAGLTFTITWEYAGKNAFYAQAAPPPGNKGKLIIDHPALNNNPNAYFLVSQVWNPGGTGGVYNNAEIMKDYDVSTGRWVISNSNNAVLPDRAAFNFIVTQKPKEELVIGATTSSAQVVTTGIGNTTFPAATDATVVASLAKDANLDFENIFFNWSATGNAFGNKAINGNPVLTDRVLKSMNYDAGGIGGDYWKGMAYPIGIKGNGWISSFYEQQAGTGGIGTLTSKTIKAENAYLTFLLSGGSDFNKLYVELQVKKTDWDAVWGPGKRAPWGETEDGFIKAERISPSINGDDMFRYYFDLQRILNGQYINKNIRIRIVDEKTGTWGYINADDFVFKNNLQEYLSFMKNGYSMLADKNKPVWGFADTHAHWMNHVGLKGLMHGTPGGKLDTSDVRNDIPPCDGFNHNLPTITPGLLLAQVEKAAFNRAGERMADPGNALCAAFTIPTALAAAPVSGTAALAGALDVAIGNFLITAMFNPAFQICGHQFTKDVFAKHYNNKVPEGVVTPTYVDYPRWNTFFHQLMHITWVKRSFDGGQRLMVVPLGVAKSWEFNTTADGVMGSPKKNIEEAAAELKKLVALNNDWVEIAYTPADARRIILSNKMAVIIALEQAEIGSYFPHIADEVNWIDTLGIRHVFPIHNINNTLGGAAVFESRLISYNDLVNRQSQNSSIVSFNVREGYTDEQVRNKTYTTFRFGNSLMRQGMRTVPIAGFGTIPLFYINDVPAEYGYERGLSHKNALGLTDKGRQYIQLLMKKGMVIEVDHMGDLSQDATMRMMNQYNYPAIAGHAHFREMRTPMNGRLTSDDQKKRTEFTIHDTRADEIINSGGMIGIMNFQNDVENAANCPVKNNCPGGTPTFSQSYWYLLQKLKPGGGIAFGSDFNGFAIQTAPRFGVDAAAALEGDELRNQKEWGERDENNRRRTYAFLQKRGVKYDSKINTWHYHRFLKPSFLTSEEREIWEAIAMAKSGTDLMQAWQPGGPTGNVERTIWQQNKIRNMANGFRWAQEKQPTGDYGNFLQCHDIADGLRGECPNERWAAYMCVHGEISIPAHLKHNRTMELYRIMKPIYNLWMEFENGPNEPLRRSYAYPGGRDFDFNLDGLAHYGMYPDMIQDMKNIGMAPHHLRPLFLGAEQYISMWEKAEAAKNTMGN